MHLTPRDCANELLEVIPLMMRVIRAQVRSHSGPELSVAQFRTLAFLGRNETAMLGDVANFLALTLPAASKLVDGLVAAGFARREVDPADRRKIVLTLTAQGRRKYAAALRVSADYLADRMLLLDVAEREQIARAMKSLHAVFADEPSETRTARAKPTRGNHAS
jgi:DNA-binding MarR family transcriptional regulator